MVLQPRETFVIGESYKPGKEPSGTISSRDNFVIGSRHGGSSYSDVVNSRNDQQKSPRSGSVIIGANYRRKRSFFLPFF